MSFENQLHLQDVTDIVVVAASLTEPVRASSLKLFDKEQEKFLEEHGGSEEIIVSEKQRRKALNPKTPGMTFDF